MSTIPQRCGVIGGGRMGSGIAHALLMSGSSVTLVDADDAAVDAATERVRRALDESASRGLIADGAQVMAEHFVASSHYGDVSGAELVIEAVPEIEELKVSVLRRLEQVLDPTAIVATNTSSLSITELASTLSDPSRVIGLHFFNPVPASLLVEIVRGDATDPDLVERARGWVADLGKQSITVKDSPGFATSRLGNILGVEAMRMVEEGVASAEDIDRGMVLGYKHPVGPLRLTDIIGLDVRLEICQYLARTVGSQFDPPAILIDKVAAGELGRKSGRGFYDWSD